MLKFIYKKGLRCNIPEGVEVKLSAEIIRPLIKGKRIITFNLLAGGRYANSDPAGWVEFKKEFTIINTIIVQDISTKGKFMYWTFHNEWYMFCTFGMTGQWSLNAGKHPCLDVTYEDNNVTGHLYFNDPRHFGTIKFVHGKDKLQKKLSELGWDPLSKDWQFAKPYVTELVKATTKPIGQILMDQKVFAGVGNYIRAEALYQAKISPWRSGNALSVEDIDRLGTALTEVMKESYAHQGATIHTYATPYGEEGKYSSCFKVYGQKQDPLGNPIKTEITPEGRTIHWCPAVQS
jgi:formamidopyrimidine-DNA glycosylase